MTIGEIAVHLENVLDAIDLVAGLIPREVMQSVTIVLRLFSDRVAWLDR
jgi:hypothetical protein